MLAQGLFLTIYGLGMLLAPGTFTGFWPWKVDSFHSQIYCAVFISGGIGSVILSRGGSAIEHLVLGLIQICLGIVSIPGIVLVDNVQHRVDWSLAGTILWIVLFVWLAVAGIALVWKVRQSVPAVEQSPIRT
jgi:hypothetical protein